MGSWVRVPPRSPRKIKGLFQIRPAFASQFSFAGKRSGSFPNVFLLWGLPALAPTGLVAETDLSRLPLHEPAFDLGQRFPVVDKHHLQAGCLQDQAERNQAQAL